MSSELLVLSKVAASYKRTQLLTTTINLVINERCFKLLFFGVLTNGFASTKSHSIESKRACIVVDYALEHKRGGTFLKETTFHRFINPRVQLIFDVIRRLYRSDTFSNRYLVLFKPFWLFLFIIDHSLYFLLLDFNTFALCLVSKRKIGWLFWHISTFY